MVDRSAGRRGEPGNCTAAVDQQVADARVLADPASVVLVQSLDESSVKIAVRPWVKPDDHWTMQ